MLLMSTHNICFYSEIRRNINRIPGDIQTVSKVIQKVFIFFLISAQKHNYVVVTHMFSRRNKKTFLPDTPLNWSFHPPPHLHPLPSNPTPSVDSRRAVVAKVYAQLLVIGLAGLSGSVGCTIRLETRRSRVQPPPRSATFFR